MHVEKREKPSVHKGRPLSKELTPMPYHRREKERGAGGGGMLLTRKIR